MRFGVKVLEFMVWVTGYGIEDCFLELGFTISGLGFGAGESFEIQAVVLLARRAGGIRYRIAWMCKLQMMFGLRLRGMLKDNDLECLVCGMSGIIETQISCLLQISKSLFEA